MGYQKYNNSENTHHLDMSFEIGVIPIISPWEQMHFPNIERVHLDQHQLTTNSKYTKLSPNEVRTEPNEDQPVAY